MPEERQYQCSYYSKLCGLLGGLKHTISLCHKFGIDEWDLELKCDRLEAISKAEKYDYPPSTSVIHFDLISSLHEEINNHLDHISFEHMKGHCNKGTRILNLYKQINIVVDSRAKVVLWEMIVHNTPPSIL